MEDLDLLEIETNVLMDMEDIDVDGIIDEVPMAVIESKLKEQDKLTVDDIPKQILYVSETENLPLKEKKAPNVETKTPIVETKTPAIETKTPIVETKTPIVETKMPTVETRRMITLKRTDGSMRKEKSIKAGFVSPDEQPKTQVLPQNTTTLPTPSENKEDKKIETEIALPIESETKKKSSKHGLDSSELHALFEQSTTSILTAIDTVHRAEGVYLLNEIARRYDIKITVHDVDVDDQKSLEKPQKIRKIVRDAARNGKPSRLQQVQGAIGYNAMLDDM